MNLLNLILKGASILFSKSIHNYVVTSTLPPEFGGRTKSLLERTKNLSEKFDMRFTLISTNYNPNYYKVYESYRKNKYVNENIDFLNIYDFFSGRKYTYKKITKITSEIKGYESFEVENGAIYRYFKDGYYEKYRKFDKTSGVLVFEDIMDIYTRKRKERNEYNAFGICHKKIIYKRNTTNVLEEIFYNDKGEAYLAKNYNGAEDNKLVRIYLFQKKTILMFNSEKEFFQYAFEQIIQDGGVTFCDARLLDKPLLESKVSTEKFFVLHSSHYLDGNIRGSYKYLIDNTNKAGKVIVLTHEQASDLIGLGINADKLAVIPHSVNENKISERQNIEKKFVYLGRLAPEKQVAHIINAFKTVQNIYPNYFLEIYGEGNESKTLIDKVNNLDLKEQVKLMGRTDDIKSVFDHAVASIVTSSFEGFGLVIMESLHYGCPVISYDFKYGPRDLIKDGVNGYITSENNIETLADTMIKIIEHPIHNAELSSDFYLSSTIDKWRELLTKY